MSKVKILDLPAMTPEALDSLDLYLSEVIGQAERACRRCGRYKGDDPFGHAKRSNEYWRNVCSAIRWLRGNIRQARHARGGNGGRHVTRQ